MFEKDAAQEAAKAGAFIASGAPVIEGSDIDLLIFKEDGPEERRSWISSGGREVNLLVTADKSRVRALRHRDLELRLCARYPERAQEVASLKEAGIKTEAAWCRVFGIVTEDPYSDIFQLEGVVA